jgi:hypothetical protein
MAINNELILEWIDHVSNIDGLLMDPVSLADDVTLMAFVFVNENEFLQAMNNVIRTISQLIEGKVDTSQLERNYSGWDSFHFQSKRAQRHRADLRVVFQTTAQNSIKVRGFGHRHLPLDIYDRLKPR